MQNTNLVGIEPKESENCEFFWPLEGKLQQNQIVNKFDCSLIKSLFIVLDHQLILKLLKEKRVQLELQGLF